MMFRCAIGSCFIFLLMPMFVYAADTDIVINEIAAYEASDYEWIEIYNKGAIAVDITGWKFFEANTSHKLTAYRGSMTIEPGAYAVIANKVDKVEAKYPSFSGTLIDSSWSSLSESGELIALKNAKGDTIEQFTYSEAKNTSLERKNVNSADYTSANWSKHSSGNTIGVQNSNTASQQSSQQQKLVFGKWRPQRGSVIINELVSDPTDREEEWLELYNTTEQKIKLEGWILENGSGVVAALSGELGIHEGERYRVVALSSGFLANAGDRIAIKSGDRILIDEVTYGIWDDGDLRDNAPRADDPFSLARIATTFSNRDDFRITRTPTKGEPNRIASASADDIQPPRIIITEVMPNPASRDPVDEFIELYNPNDVPVSLRGWELMLLNDERYVFLAGETIAPHEYRSYGRATTNLSLANSGGERIRLYAPTASRCIDEVRYVENAPLQLSYARGEDGVFAWTKTPTPGNVNIIAEDNHAPHIVIHAPVSSAPDDPLTFDASDTFDQDRDPLTFHWDFGDGQTATEPIVYHSYHEEDAFDILLTVSDGKTSAAQFHHVVIEDMPSDEISSQEQTRKTIKKLPAQKKEIIQKSKEHSKTTSHAKNTVQQKPPIATPLLRIRALPPGAHVRVEGVVSAQPNLLSASYFYIAGSGIQIWSPKKAFPKLERGDRISVEGTMRKNGDELAIRIDGAKAVTILGHEEEPSPHDVKLSDVGESFEGALVRVAGTVADMRWPNIYLEEGDARVRLYAAKNAGIDKNSVHKGDTITAAGIVSETSAGYRMLLRDQNDIVASNAPSGQILGEKTSEGRVLTLPEREDPRKNLFRYFLVTLIATIVILGGLAIQYYLDRKKSK